VALAAHWALLILIPFLALADDFGSDLFP